MTMLKKTWKFLKLAVKFDLNLFELLHRIGNEDHLTVRSVFGLRKQIGGNKCSICTIICKHFYFAWSSRHINSNHRIRTINLFFSFGHVGISWSKYFINFRNGFCSKS